MHQQWGTDHSYRAEELLELDAAKDVFSLDLVGDSDSDSGLESEDEY